MQFSGAIIGELTQIPALDAAGDFHLLRVNLVRAGCPKTLLATRANTMAEMPIVIAHNREKHGWIEKTQYCPKAVVVAGADRRAVLLKNSILASWAWVEAGAMKANDEAMGTYELSQKLTHALARKYVGPQLNYQELPFLAEAYPFENVCVFGFRNGMYRQAFALSNEDRNVSLVGPVVRADMGIVNACTDVMPLSQTGARYAWAPVHGHHNIVSMGAKNSELYIQIIRNWDNINEAADAYVEAVKHGLYTPMTPSFQPVAIPANHKPYTALAAQGIPPADFAIWSEAAQKKIKDEKALRKNLKTPFGNTSKTPTSKKGWLNKAKATGDSTGMGL